MKKVVDYDVPCASSINDDQVYPCCGLFKLEKMGGPSSQFVWMSYSPTDDSYSSLKHLSVIFVIKIVFLQQILFYTKNVFIYVCLCLFVPFVISPILLILVYVCILLKLMGVQKQQFLIFN